MEFVLGLSVDLHVGKIIRRYLESIFYDLGLLTSIQVQKIEQINNIEDDISSILDEVSIIKEITEVRSITPSSLRQERLIFRSSAAYNRR